jgi:sialic acid synthase SpsE/quercetin dioxygenase-like cupin family protein
MAETRNSGETNADDLPLFVFEMANNHMGDLAHGLRIIDECAKVSEKFNYDFAFKLQYRELDTFIHPSFQARMDMRMVKRFMETRLSRQDTSTLVSAIKARGFKAICTPFDEVSVSRIVDDGFDTLKIASCSFTDWPLLEKIACARLPIIASTAGASVEDMDRVVSFFANRQRALSLMACVAEYPTPAASLELNQIELLRERYPSVRVGYSTHEEPDETLPVVMAVAKGARIFEKHVGVPTESYSLNAYSANPEQVRRWLEAAEKAFAMAGRSTLRDGPGTSEQKALGELRRGVYLKRDVDAGRRLTDDDVCFAIPAQGEQITANEWSKYRQYFSGRKLEAGSPLLHKDTTCNDVHSQVRAIVMRVKQLITESNGVVPGEAVLELSHHYGLERFGEAGATMITVVNRSYCKKLIAVLPGQRHPAQFHKIKEETFHVLHGTLNLTVDGRSRLCHPGDVITIMAGAVHEFDSDTGCVFEEISSTHIADDSFYCDEAINRNTSRKTILRYWL